MKKQAVHLSKTMSGQAGLFTGSSMAWPLSPEELTVECLTQIVERCGFEYQGDLSSDLSAVCEKE